MYIITQQEALQQEREYQELLRQNYVNGLNRTLVDIIHNWNPSA